MKKLYAYFACISLICFISSCKKQEVSSTDFFDEAAIHTDDQARFSTDIDAIANDVNIALEMTPGFSGKTASILGSVCDATIIADTVSNPRSITITYNGTGCLTNRKRTGMIKITMDANTRWKNPGAEINVSFINLRITRLKDNKDMVFNGKFRFTNVSGELISDLASVSNVTHTILSDDIDIIFDNGKEWSWKTARKRVYRQDNGIVIFTTGTQSGGGIIGIGDWGNTRAGQPFLTQILLPLESREDCNFRVVRGKIEIILTDRLYATGNLGRDETGSPISCPGANSYWLELTWRDPTGTRCVLRLPYE